MKKKYFDVFTTENHFNKIIDIIMPNKLLQEREIFYY
jgi:hypothetical protein